MGTVLSSPAYVWNSAISILDEICDEDEMHSIEVLQGNFIIKFIEANDIPPVDYLNDPNPYLRSFLAMVRNNKNKRKSFLLFFRILLVLRIYRPTMTRLGNTKKSAERIQLPLA